MIKNIIFDFDGVIVDSEIIVAKAYSKYLAKKNIIFTVDNFSIYAGKKTFEVIDDLSKKFNIIDKKKFFNDIMDISTQIYTNDLKEVYGVKNFLEKTNKIFFIGSNSIKKRIILGLKKVNLYQYFSEDKIFSFDMVKKPKPDPDIYLSIVNKHKLNKNETVIIEDSCVGVQAGIAAGIQVIGLTAGGHWNLNRSTKELLDSGAYLLIDNYDNLLIEIDKL